MDFNLHWKRIYPLNRRSTHLGKHVEENVPNTQSRPKQNANRSGPSILRSGVFALQYENAFVDTGAALLFSFAMLSSIMQATTAPTTIVVPLSIWQQYQT